MFAGGVFRWAGDDLLLGRQSFDQAAQAGYQGRAELLLVVGCADFVKQAFQRFRYVCCLGAGCGYLAGDQPFYVVPGVCGDFGHNVGARAFCVAGLYLAQRLLGNATRGGKLGLGFAGLFPRYLYPVTYCVLVVFDSAGACPVFYFFFLYYVAAYQLGLAVFQRCRAKAQVGGQFGHVFGARLGCA